MNIWFLAAACMSCLTFFVHVIAGGKEIAEQHLKYDLSEPVVKYTMYYCWHLVTMVLLAMTVGFAISAFRPEMWFFAAEWTIVSLLFAIWSVALVILSKQSPWHLIQWVLFFPIAVLGAAGLIL